jgi:hypothetical protein
MERMTKQTYEVGDVTYVTNRCQLNAERLVVLSDAHAECCPELDQFQQPPGPDKPFPIS